jgi:hypothetical protein
MISMTRNTSQTLTQRSDFMPAYIELKCKCGRTLRARKEQGGTTVRCWDCQADVMVPRVRTGDKLARESLRSARGVLVAESFAWIALGAVVLTCALAIPFVGLPLGVGLILAASPLYCRAIERSGLRGTSASVVACSRSREETKQQWVMSMVVSAGLMAPLVLRHLVMDGAGLFLGIGGVGVALVALSCWLVLPLLLLGFSACDCAGAVGFRQALRATLKHPLATASALLVLPLGLIVFEFVLIGCTAYFSWFGALVSDLFPGPGIHGNTVVFGRGVFYAPGSSFETSLWRYSDGLHQGYTLLGAIPASLPRGVHTSMTKWLLNLDLWLYLAVRMFLSCLIFMAVGSVLAVQARWLGLIPSIDSPRSSPLTSV